MPAPLMPPPMTAIRILDCLYQKYANRFWQVVRNDSSVITVTSIDTRRGGDLAVMLTGGGARGAYQVGLLRGIARHFPHLRFQIITGVSAGAINAVFL